MKNTVKPSFANYLKRFTSERVLKNQEQQRDGQLYMNLLYDAYPELHELVSGSCVDPFYNDTRLDAFFMFLSVNWNTAYAVNSYNRRLGL
jgi:hypothetical protein